MQDKFVICYLILQISDAAVHIGSLGTALQRGDWYKATTYKEPLIVMMKGSESGGYLLSHNAVQYHRRCWVCCPLRAALPRPSAPALCLDPRPLRH